MANQNVLLFNASNLETFPVFPYAFIQVPAIARRSGITVICKDLLGIPQERWPQTIPALMEQYNPAAILITLRNIDTLAAQDYEPDRLKEGETRAYFPIERTKALIAAIRALSDRKIVVGGFGFSLLPTELMHDLRPDFGVVEGPDDFFAHFDDVLNGSHEGIANLIYFREDQLISNPRTLYAPSATAEYTAQAIEAMKAFYTAFPSPGFQGAAVEIMRGCNHTCVFCAEPLSKGTQVRYRDLSAVMEDIEILSSHGITRLYLISSELNPEGNEFILELADHIWLFNEKQAEDRKTTWYGANFLLNFAADEYERLYRSGFTGGWFDITALDDENARAMRTPYRNVRLLPHLKIYAAYQKKQVERLRAQKDLGVEAKIQAGDGRGSEFTVWSMFLGNTATTLETIRNTLHLANQEGLPEIFDRCGIVNSTRVFDYQKPTETTLAATYSVTCDLKRIHYQQLLPSFVYPPALLQSFSEKEIVELFNHIAETYLSKKYQQTRDWLSFLQQQTTSATLLSWMRELGQAPPGPSVFDDLFANRQPDGHQNSKANQVAKEVVYLLVSACLEMFPDFFETLSLPGTADALHRTTPYELATAVFQRWQSVDEMMAQTQSISPDWQRDLLQFCVQALLYRFNVQITPKYRQLFIPEQYTPGSIR